LGLIENQGNKNPEGFQKGEIYFQKTA